MMENSNWVELPIKDVALKLTSGGTPSTKNSEYYANGNIPWLNTKEVDFNRITSTEKYITEEGLKNSSAKWIQENSVIVAMYGATAAKVAISKIPLTTNQACCNIIVNHDICDYEYLFYNISNKYSELENIAVGAAQQNLSVGVIGEFILKFPPLPEQKAIASVLSSLDDKIDLLHQQNQTLEALAETLFRQWFVEEAEDSWEEGVLGNEFDFTMGQSPKGDTFNEIGEGIPMYQGNRDFGFRFPTNRVYTTDPKRFAEKFDTLISVRAPVGAQNMANEKCCIGRGVAAFRYKANPEFYSYTYFKMRSLMDEIKKFNDAGTVFGSIGKRDFENLELIIPSYNQVVEFQNRIKPIDDKVIFNTEQIQTLEKLRDTLLPKLMSGEVRVKL